ncbi:MAG TPA: MFS transporter [Nocardioides sp.]|uniref:MFS transporter n=1 Tax=Nocardioides sp. TaxID=35761 RepID=UPI002ED81083
MSGYLRATFRSLRHRAYRLYFIGQTISTVGTWAQKVAQAWLVLQLGGSGTVLGVTVGLQQAPTLFLTPWAGLLADRIDRRTMLLWTQVCAAVPAAVLAVLALLDRVTLPAVMVLAVAVGVVEAFDKPVRHTFAADVVPPEDMTNAVTLNATMFNAGKVLGPAAAGIAISVLGVAATFLFNVFSFLVMIVTLVAIRPGEIRPRELVPKELGALRAGLGYARRTPVIFTALALTTLTGLVAYEWNTAVPLLAREFSPDAATIGFFFAAMGAGAIVGSLALAGALVASPRTFLIGGGVFAVTLGLVAAAPTMGLALVALFMLGATATTFRALATSLIQLESEPGMRGRMVSLLIMALNGTSPVSAPLIGAVAEGLGARVAVGAGAGLSLAAAVVCWRYLAAVAPERLRRESLVGARRA